MDTLQHWLMQSVKRFGEIDEARVDQLAAHYTSLEVCQSVRIKSVVSQLGLNPHYRMFGATWSNSQMRSSILAKIYP